MTAERIAFLQAEKALMVLNKGITIANMDRAAEGALETMQAQVLAFNKQRADLKRKADDITAQIAKHAEVSVAKKDLETKRCDFLIASKQQEIDAAIASATPVTP